LLISSADAKNFQDYPDQIENSIKIGKEKKRLRNKESVCFSTNRTFFTIKTRLLSLKKALFETKQNHLYENPFSSKNPHFIEKNGFF
jgi:hypothetical protein